MYVALTCVGGVTTLYTLYKECLEIRKLILYFFAAIFLIGGIMGIIKGLFPHIEWLSFRYLLGSGTTFKAENMPLYARVYGIIMGILEIFAAILIFIQQKKWFSAIEIILGINMIGCVVAIVIGDTFAITSLILRLVPLYIIDKERRAV